MQTRKFSRLVQTVVGIACVAACASSFADCRTARAATAADVAGGQADALLKAMVAACKTQEPARFFSLQSQDANRILGSSSAADKTKLFAQYCAFTADAVSGLGGNLDAAVHSVGPYKNKAKCGALASYWFVHDRSANLVLRLEVAVESGRIKIDTH